LVDIYPRFGPTSLWDISAAHIILAESGGFVLDLKTNNELIYDPSSLINNYFFAVSQREYIDFFKPYLTKILDF
jgi:3'(2'), 5'-bisphosphate nucleotidase